MGPRRGSAEESKAWHCGARSGTLGGALKPWLPRKDSNLDKEIQNLSCYHYTTRHRRASDLSAACLAPQVPPRIILATSRVNDLRGGQDGFSTTP